MKRSKHYCLTLTVLAVLLSAPIATNGAPKTAPGQFTPLVPLAPPTIIHSAEAYPGGSYNVDNILDGIADGSRASEYASASKGTGTFIDFDFGKPTRIAAFKHVDRFDPATVDTAELIFTSDAKFADVVAKVPIKHANTRGGVTFLPFAPVTARYVRWQVTAVKSYSTVGGAEIAFFSAGKPEPAPVKTAVEPAASPALLKEDGKLVQPFQVAIEYHYAEPAEGTLEISGADPIPLSVRPGSQTIDLSLPAVEKETPVEVAVKIAGQSVAATKLVRKPVRPWVLYFLPHSHVDIGYTHVQTEVEETQWKHLELALELVRRTADYPPEARFKWNAEVLWAVDSYLKQATPQERQALVEAVRSGSIHLDALYGNELTALCRPEELFRLLDCARRLSRQYDLTIDAAMITDVPGYTWGIVPAMAHSGVKYFSIGPNHIHRIGRTLSEWADKAFYWKSPSGQQQVLCWVAGKGYSWFHGGRLGDISKVEPRAIFQYLGELSESGYPYDMVHVRYNIGGDNGPPDPNLPEFVKAWNAKYTHPKIVIATTREMFREFERRYADQVPEVRGDFTPYWEDGAGSSARETALARNASERLVQAEALWAMLNPREYPADDFYAAWRNVLLYNEHTWGAHCSISQPDSQFTKDQWEIKQAFALEAEKQSKALQELAVAEHAAGTQKVTAVDVYNTSSWPRTDLVKMPQNLAPVGEIVKDSNGQPVPSQMFRIGNAKLVLAFLAKDVPPLGAKRFLLEPGECKPVGSVELQSDWLSSERIRVRIDKNTGAIASLTWKHIPVDLADQGNGSGLNDYWYVAGKDPNGAKRSGAVEFYHGEKGPLCASLAVVSDKAPGCSMLYRAIRLIDGIDRVDVMNMVGKEKVLTKEALHFGFPFNVPDGVIRMDTPWAVVRPEADQLPGACKNYFTVGRWVDVSNDEFGVTWSTPDAPLAEVGTITVDVPNPFQPESWIEHLGPTQTFYSYVMNNYWETNYKASQGGRTTFRYSIRPHKKFDPVAAARFGIEQSQPLIVVPVDPDAPPVPSLFRVEPESVMVTSLKPSEDGKALMVRLHNASDTAAKATLKWTDPGPKSVSLSSPFEEQGPKLTGPIDLPPHAIATLRAELPE